MKTAGHARRSRGLEFLFADPAEPQGSQARDVGHAEEVVGLHQRARLSALTFGASSFGTLH